MKKIILILGLMLGVCLSVYGVSQREVDELYAFLDSQHEEHPGWVSVEFTGSNKYLGDMGYHVGVWIAYYGYTLEDYSQTGPNKIEILLINDSLLKENGLAYDRSIGKIVEIETDEKNSWVGEDGTKYERVGGGTIKITTPSGRVYYAADGGECDE